jgi:hypothetical protein
VSQDFSWLGPQSRSPEPHFEYICSFWTVRGATGRDVTCSAYRTDTGLELRAEYGPEEIVASQLFRGADADERLAEAADAWRLNLLAKAFHEIAR